MELAWGLFGLHSIFDEHGLWSVLRIPRRPRVERGRPHDLPVWRDMLGVDEMVCPLVVGGELGVTRHLTPS